ncbi:MAG TPA: hypothetical protein DCM73_16210 [Clostridiales bacterium]|nr:hypothetical protein [Clostridiales bacterium]
MSKKFTFRCTEGITMKQYNYMTFKSVSYAMKVESALRKYDIQYKIIPVPRSISSSCGLCIRFFGDDIDRLKSIIEDNSLIYEKIYMEA